jgi:hypothetical protein
MVPRYFSSPVIRATPESLAVRLQTQPPNWLSVARILLHHGRLSVRNIDRVEFDFVVGRCYLISSLPRLKRPHEDQELTSKEPVFTDKLHRPHGLFVRFDSESNFEVFPYFDSPASSAFALMTCPGA